MSQTHNISLYDFKGHHIRIYGTTEEPWFLVKDVAQILDINNPREFVSTLDESQKDDVSTTDTIGRIQKMTIIDESAVYEMIFKSRKPEAQQFKRWVCKEVLPSLRRKGKYELEQEKITLQQRVNELERKRYMIYDKNVIRIIDRIFELEKIKKEDYYKVMRNSIIKLSNGKDAVISHPHKGILQGNLLAISNLMSAERRVVMGIEPNMRNGDRCNAYFLEDYERYGDNIINDFFEEKPFETWGIDLSW